MGKRKTALFLFLAVLVLGLIIGGIYYKYQATKKVASTSNVQPTQAPSEELAIWTDPAEFEFNYPKSLKLNPHDEDKENYAHVELTSATSSGNLTVWVKDTTAVDIETWVAQAKIKGAIDSNLGGEPAKKILTDGGTQKLLVATIRDGYLYQIEVDTKSSDFWNKVYETVSSSFKFISGDSAVSGENTAAEDAAGQTSQDEESNFEEEVIE